MSDEWKNAEARIIECLNQIIGCLNWIIGCEIQSESKLLTHLRLEAWPLVA